MFIRLKLNFLILFGMVLTIPGIAFSQGQSSDPLCDENQQPSAITVLTNLTNSCFENFNVSEAYGLQARSDRNVCSCLPTDPLLRESFNNLTVTPSGQHDLAEVRDTRISNENKRLNAFRNGLLFQAAILSNSTEESTRILQMYSQNYLPTSGLSIAQASFEAIATQEGLAPTTIRLEVPEFDTNLLSSSSNQCISPRDFLAFKQLPSHNQFYAGLAQATSFVPEDWNYQNLQSEFSRLAGTADINMIEGGIELSPEQERARIIMFRMKFLNRNPLYKSLFMSPTSGENSQIVQEAQQKLFASIKKNLTPPAGACDVANREDRGCYRSIASSSGMALLKNETLSIFRDPTLAQVITDTALAEWNRRIENLPRLLNYNDNNGRVFLMEAAGLPPRSEDLDCGDPNNLDRCLENFKAYCPSVNALKEHQESYERLYPGLFQSQNFERGLVDDFNTNEASSNNADPGFRELNQSICGSERFSGTTPETKSDFNTFKQAHCLSNPTAPVCTDPENDSARTQLVSDYLKAFPSVFNSESELTDDYNDEAKAFGDFLASASLASVTQVEMNEVRTTNTTVEEHRSFMGGVGTLFRRTGGLVGDISRGTVNAISSGATAIGRAASTVASAAPAATTSIFPAVAAIAPSIAQAVTQATQTPIPERVISESRNQTPTLSNIERDTLAQELENLRKLNSDRSSSSPENNSFYEQRIRSLEGQLARVDAANTLAARTLAHATEAQRAPAEVSREGSFEGVSAGSAGGAGARIVGGGSVAGAASGGPGQMNSSLTEASTISAQVKGDSSINRALLAAHDSRANADVRGSIIVVQEKNPGEIEQINQASVGSTLPLNVPAEVYSAFESRDPETLERYQQAILGVTGSVVKISVDSPGRQTIVMYAIKQSDGRVVFQPIRKSTLKDLQNSIQI